jgi:hypothetical protein
MTDEKEVSPTTTEMEENLIDEELVHYADAKKSGLSTLCGKPIPPAKESMMKKDITCKTCDGLSAWGALPRRPSH